MVIAFLSVSWMRPGCEQFPKAQPTAIDARLHRLDCVTGHLGYLFVSHLLQIGQDHHGSLVVSEPQLGPRGAARQIEVIQSCAGPFLSGPWAKTILSALFGAGRG